MLIVVMALGCPTFRFVPATIELLIFGLVLLLALHIGAWLQPWIQRYLLAGQLAILGVLITPMLLFAQPETYDDHSGSLRLHIGVAIIIILSIALGIAWCIAVRLFNPVGRSELARALPTVDLFPPTNRYDFMGTSPLAALLSAWFIVPVRHPVELLLPGSLLVLFAPDRFLPWVFVTMGLLSWIGLFLGVLFERLMEILKTVGRLFFVGPQFAISLLVIVIALARLNDVHYVTYLFNAGSTGYGNTKIMGYLALSYLAAWYYAFWCDQFAARRVIRLLGGSVAVGPPFEVRYNYVGKQHLSPIKSDGRLIALHGAGRLKIQGEYEEGYEAQGAALQFQTPSELLATFRQQIEQMPETKNVFPDPLPSVRDFQRSALVFPVITSALAFILITGPSLLSFLYAVQPPELEIHRTTARNLDPASLLASETAQTGACPPLGPSDARIAVAASGGGTRAAIYTASVLHGLAQEGKICNVVLVSGVSGGSAALAYFALHERELRRPGDPDNDAWGHFSKVMADPFIEDVLERAGDLRTTFGRRSWQPAVCGEYPQKDEEVHGWMPARTRLGSILAESFVCNMGTGVMGSPYFGLMLNASLLGSFEAMPSCDDKNLSLSELVSSCPKLRDGGVAGGRLVLTNLKAPTHGAAANEPAAMQIIPIDDVNLSIARAAALSSNFPPVFSDAAIDVLPDEKDSGRQRYWVTDGGAVENRGAMTLYLFVRDALKSLDRSVHLAPLRIVIADVSASAGGYAESFGFNSVLQAGGQLGLGMEGEVFSDIHDIYCEHGSSATVHEIDMPRVLRDAIGTHWLLPGSLTFTEPEQQAVTLYSADVKKLVLALFSKGEPSFDDKNANTVFTWLKDSASKDHTLETSWNELVAVLSNSRATPNDCVDRSKGGASFVQ
ncbi:patatin-like phospholipase family protein [Mesorhizobium sp. B3-2-1]|uniref:patatin-like phospholipase family protein n=1 Tax=Mesorhizobium sp. B3-2-1 TaxID=2589891 RepID=UPI001FF073CD|nr:patatin-like phospholipase family protein [Mesorhizobium sp. B3-2-1]